MSRSTNKSRVLDALKTGPKTTAQLCQPDVGGVRFGARLLELRDEGHVIQERRLRSGSSLYTLVGVGGTAAPSDGLMGGPPVVAVGTARGGSPEAHEPNWRREWMCPRCAYQRVDGPECPRGHQAVPGWHGDFRTPATVQNELPEAA